MENKYYTPTLEEFHIGFEYEKTNPYYKDIWVSETMEDLRELHWHDNAGHGMPYEGSDYYFDGDNIENIRVKYLDKEDIESLGGVYIGRNYRFKHATWGQFFTVSLYDDTDNILIRRYVLRNGENYTTPGAGFHDRITFEGHVKNKAELKKILKQLGIYEENTKMA